MASRSFAMYVTVCCALAGIAATARADVESDALDTVGRFWEAVTSGRVDQAKSFALQEPEHQTAVAALCDLDRAAAEFYTEVSSRFGKDIGEKARKKGVLETYFASVSLGLKHATVKKSGSGVIVSIERPEREYTIACSIVDGKPRVDALGFDERGTRCMAEAFGDATSKLRKDFWTESADALAAVNTEYEARILEGTWLVSIPIKGQWTPFLRLRFVRVKRDLEATVAMAGGDDRRWILNFESQNGKLQVLAAMNDDRLAGEFTRESGTMMNGEIIVPGLGQVKARMAFDAKAGK